MTRGDFIRNNIMALALCLVPRVLLPQAAPIRGQYFHSVSKEMLDDEEMLKHIHKNARRSAEMNFKRQGLIISGDEIAYVDQHEDDFVQNRVTFVYQFDLEEI